MTRHVTYVELGDELTQKRWGFVNQESAKKLIQENQKTVNEIANQVFWVLTSISYTLKQTRNLQNSMQRAIDRLPARIAREIAKAEKEILKQREKAAATELAVKMANPQVTVIQATNKQIERADSRCRVRRKF